MVCGWDAGAKHRSEPDKLTMATSWQMSFHHIGADVYYNYLLVVGGVRDSFSSFLSQVPHPALLRSTRTLLRPLSLPWRMPPLPVIRSLRPPCRQTDANLPLSPTPGLRPLPSSQPPCPTRDLRLPSEKTSPRLPLLPRGLPPHLDLPGFQMTSRPTSAMGTLIR